VQLARDAPTVKGAIGRAWWIRGYQTGDFVGRLDWIGKNTAFVTVLDTLRPLPRIEDRCPFPGCVRGDFHGGDHELATIRVGALVEISWAFAKWVPAEGMDRRDAWDTLDPWNVPCSIRE
jgi:hypothetical protein